MNELIKAKQVIFVQDFIGFPKSAGCAETFWERGGARKRADVFLKRKTEQSGFHSMFYGAPAKQFYRFVGKGVTRNKYAGGIFIVGYEAAGAATIRKNPEGI